MSTLLDSLLGQFHGDEFHLDAPSVVHHQPGRLMTGHDLAPIIERKQRSGAPNEQARAR
jgi:hypothetical protein